MTVKQVISIQFSLMKFAAGFLLQLGFAINSILSLSELERLGAGG